MDWNDPVARLALVESVGHAEYNRLMEEHNAAIVFDVVNGHALRPVSSRFGRLIMVGDTGTAFTTVEAAQAHATTLPAGSTPPKDAPVAVQVEEPVQ